MKGKFVREYRFEPTLHLSYISSVGINFLKITIFSEKPKTGLGLDDSPRAGSPKSDDEQKQEETRIEVQIPKINTNLGDNIHFVRFPNFLSVEPRPFDVEHYEDEAEEEDELDEEGRTRLKLKVENTIR